MPEIKNLKKVASRILKAIKNKERIVLYGDADLDGVTAVILVKESIKNLSGEVAAIYFPDREAEGYGISETGLNYLKTFSPALLIALDCGIGNFKEAKIAKSLGFEVIIIDHHQVLDELPKASIIVDPKQKGDKYAFKELAAAGIAFKLALLLLKNKLTRSLKQSLLELAALATVADMMPREEENKEIIEQGLVSLEDSWRPGLKAFFESEPIKNIDGLNYKISKIISVLNIRDVENRLPASFRLLTTPFLEEAQAIIKKLLEKSEVRRERIKLIVQEVDQRLAKKAESIIFEGDSTWEFSLISPVASIICQKYQRPVFIFKVLEKESQGTVRVPKGIDSVALMKKCSKYPLTYGGHALASGFRIKNENLEKFKGCLMKNSR
ncbi:MAG: hypothetical protein AUJ31_02105 [Parcubacteria group bacterium CG1_02_39_15]|uniref:Single-stranded-DNA-specific exonuclease RecJ n=4 Tax=Candidatus Nealsoniibacteriota TaxID=1817911 RepID=A0A2G9YSX4_9BACT|nr:MAG: hypothetical protein AUJ31_02105 [Parcubacteria group bacterium CG1_02_39_15]PIP22328.1 MAG: hypothetical protein COX38_01240 [Candidatus Nealsonbacteria bacterium CG23_combo_of_CG06-09_8_20_14_all_39_25]PIQ98350.1 MAG: hypothetical protein COV64_01760 [Candidatus Nealsonbacteria bacterium CG11_big_fil_rev_8_21_14_0_20_39_9]PIW90489.1 MAG: hypothetical protein COZ92_00565 [Candidatus Nealsonbacteria bacterium CG_4_8_14_3_um_filter_40_11]PIZ88292.1 MAG: hypothetical protein COX91_00930 [